MSIKDFKTRNEIVINVGRRGDDVRDDPDPFKRRGSLPPSRKFDGIRTRRRQEKIIRFFDLGQIPNGSGSWIDLDFVADPGYTIVDLSPGGNYRPEFQFNDFTLTHWAALHDKLFEIPVNDWADYYRRIEYDDGPQYGVSEYQGRGSHLSDLIRVNHANALYPGLNPEWTEKGLTPLADNIDLHSFGGLCLGINTYDLTNYKITKSFDYAAAAAGDFSLLNGGDIFLIPQIYWNALGQAVGIDAAFRQSILFGNWTVKSREILLAKTASRWFHDLVEIPIFEGYFLNDTMKSSGPYMFDFDDIGDAFATDLINWTKARGLTTLYVQRGTFASGGATFGFEPLAGFPFAAAGPQSVMNVGFEYFLESDAGNFDYQEGERFEGAGLLVGVITTPGGTYYVWRNNAQSNTWAGLGGSTSA